MGTTTIQTFEINKWGGLNLKQDARKIAPGEFVDLTNANTSDGSIKADAVDALIAMPIPAAIIDTIGPHAKEIALASTCTSATGVTAAVYLTGSFASGDIIHFGVPRSIGTAAGTGPVLSSVGLYTNVSSAPSALIASSCNYITLAAFSSGTSAPVGVTYEFWETMMTGSATGVWLRMNGPTALPCGTETGVTSMVCGASGWVASENFTCVVYKDTRSSGGHILNIVPFNFVTDQTHTTITAASGANEITFPGWKDYYFSRIKINATPYNSFFALSYNGPGGNLVNGLIGSLTNVAASRFSDTNFIQKDKNFVITNDGNQNSLSIDYDHYQDSTYDLTHTTMRPTTKRSACYFNGYFIPARNGPLIAYRTALDISSTKSIIETPLRTAPEYAKIVISYNNYLTLFNTKAYPHRMYFSTAGAIDGFSSSQYENLSDGEEIFWVEEWFGSLIIFFADRIKRYTGTPGNASLETIFYKGVPCAEVVCKTECGIFFLTSAGVYIFDGAFTKVDDLSKNFDDANMLNANQDGWVGYNNKKQELYFYPGYDHVVNVWNPEQNYFRQKDYTSAVCTGDMRFFNYYDNSDLKTAISYPSITHVSEVEGGTTYAAVTAESGWIDVSEGTSKYDKKHFDSCVIKYKLYGTASNPSFDVYIYTDDLVKSVSAAASGTGYISYGGAGKNAEFNNLKIPIGRDASLIKYKIISSAQDKPVDISSIKFFYNDTILK